MKILKLILFISLSFCTTSYAEEFIRTESIERRLLPTAQEQNALIQNLVPQVFIFAFPNQHSFEHWMELSGLSQNQRAQLSPVPRTKLNDVHIKTLNEIIGYDQLNPLNSSLGDYLYLIYDKSNLNELSSIALETFLALYPEFFHLEYITLHGETLKKVPKEATLKNHYFSYKGQTKYLLTDLSWEELPALFKLDHLQNQLEDVKESQAMESLKILVNKKNLFSVIQKYAAPNYQKRAFLKTLNRLEELGSKQSELWIDLSDLLESPYPEQLGSFSTNFGPNCMACAFGNLPYLGNLSGAVNRDEFLEHAYFNYRYLEADESLRPGDILLWNFMPENFFDWNFYSKHVAKYLGDKYFYTKNGMTQFAPYIIQTHEQIEAIYNTEGDLKFSVLRPLRLGEKFDKRLEGYRTVEHPGLYRVRTKDPFAKKAKEKISEKLLNLYIVSPKPIRKLCEAVTSLFVL